MLLFHMLNYCIIKDSLNFEKELTSNATISSITFLKRYLVSVWPGNDIICPLYQWSFISTATQPSLLCVLKCLWFCNQTRSGGKKKTRLNSPENEHTWFLNTFFQQNQLHMPVCSAATDLFKFAQVMNSWIHARDRGATLGQKQEAKD